MGFVTLEDIQGNLELVVFPRTWERSSRIIDVDKVLSVEGRVDAEGGDPKILVDNLSEITPAELAVYAPSRAGGRSHPARRGDGDGCAQQRARRLSARRLRPPAGKRSMGRRLSPMTGTSCLPRPISRTWIGSRPRPGRQLRRLPSRGPKTRGTSPGSPPGSPRGSPSARAARQAGPAETLRVEPVEPVKPARPARVDALARPVGFPPYIVSPTPLISQASRKDDQPRMVTIVLRSTGERERDVRRLKCIHGALMSSPGIDKFAFHVFEGGRRYLLEFPERINRRLSRSDRKADKICWRRKYPDRSDPISVM